MDQSALCATHRDRPATGTCARCGRFVCATCAGLDGICTDCFLHALRALPDGRARAKWATWLLFANVVSDSMSIAGGLFEKFGGASAAELSTILDGITGFASFGALVGGAITFLRWLHLSVRTTSALGHDVGATPGWACGYFFVPIAHLYKPYRVVNAMVAALGGQAQFAPVGAWWAAWIISNILSQLQFRLTMFNPTTATGDFALVLGFIASALSIAAALLCIRVLDSIQRELTARREHSPLP